MQEEVYGVSGKIKGKYKNEKRGFVIRVFYMVSTISFHFKSDNQFQAQSLCFLYHHFLQHHLSPFRNVNQRITHL